jgi:FdhD protein
MGRVTARRPARRIVDGEPSRRVETLAVEEPLELRLDGVAHTVTMRTPGHDVELAHGYLLAEGVVTRPDDVIAARYCDGCTADGQQTYNVLDVHLRHSNAALPTRNLLTTSACGVCGKSSLDDVRTNTTFPLPDTDLTVEAGILMQLPALLRENQRVFDATGGLHAAGLFTPHGDVLAVREDVGRHNAVDKILGWALLERRIPAHDTILVVSGRASFELVQKAVMAGVPILAAVSAPSSLAVDLAADSRLTLAGFLRPPSMTVYTHPTRIV